MPSFKCSRCGLNEIEAQVAGCEEGPCPMVYVGPMRLDHGVGTLGLVIAMALASVVTALAIWGFH